MSPKPRMEFGYATPVGASMRPEFNRAEYVSDCTGQFNFTTESVGGIGR